MVTLQGVIPQQVGQLTEISGEQLLKLHKGNDLWALVMLSQVSDEQCAVMELRSQIKDLIDEYEGLFKSPNELPPSKTFDHSISLLPGAVPMNCMPYRYPPQQKDEIERQMAKMLHDGLIVPSVISFASHVLLV
jgi:hypothetical protein